MSCPNTNLPEYKALAASRGDDVAYALWDLYEGNVPESEYRITNFKILDNSKSLNLTESQIKDIYDNYVNLMDRKREGKAVNFEQFNRVLNGLQVFEHNGTYIFGEWDVKNNVFKGRLMSSPNIRQLFNSLDVLFDNVNFVASVPSDIGVMLEKKGLYKLDVGKEYNFKGEDMIKNLYFSSKELVKKIFKTEPENVTVDQVKKYDTFFNYWNLIKKLKKAYESGENDKLISLLKEIGLYDYNAYKLVKKIKQGKFTEDDKSVLIDEIIKNSSNNKVNIDKTDLINNPKIYNELNTELNKILASYLSKFGIKTQLLEDLQDNLGIDSYAIVDILNKIIYADKNNQEDYPQQAGKLIAFMMQHNPLVSEITNAMKKQSMFRNLSKDELFEAVGDLISQELHKKTNTELPKTLIDSIKNLIRQFFDLITSVKMNRINKNVGVIAENILIQNQSLITQSVFKPGAAGKDLVKVSFQEALDKDKFATAIVDKMSNSFILGGSISFSEQGPVLRPDENQVHDLDWASSYPRKNTKEIFEDIYPEGQRVYIREIFDKESGEWTDTWLLCEDGHTIKNLQLSKDGKNKVLGYDIVNNKTNEVVSQYIPKLDEHTGDVVAKPIDIFSSDKGKIDEYPTQDFTTTAGTKVKLGNWRSSFAAKLRYGRLKDIWDYNRFIPTEQLFKKETSENVNQSVSLQKSEMPASKSSKETLDKVMQVITKMGVKIQDLQEYLKGNPNVKAKDSNGLADLIQGIIAIAEGKESAALTEEMVHVARAMIEQVDPKVVAEMLSKIDRFKIYKQVLKAYENDPNYKLPNGKPNIRKLKLEAVDKLIAEVIIKQSEGSTEFPELLEEENRTMIALYWQKILDWFRGQYKKANINIFEQTAERIIESPEQFQSIENGEVFLQKSKQQELSPQQTVLQERLLNTQRQLEKREDKNAPIDPLLMDTEESSNYYVEKNPDGTETKVLKRVTDRVKQWYTDRFGKDKKFTEAEKVFNELKRDYGVQFHNMFELVHGRYFNSDGTRKTNVDPRHRMSDNVNSEIYTKIENYYVELIKSFSKDGKTPLVFSEVMLYDPKIKEAGTIDLLIIEENGKTHIFDWKFMSVSKNANDVPWFKQGAFNIQLGRYKDILRENYGVKEFGNMRAIPILMDFKAKNNKANSPLTIAGVSIGSVDVSKIEDLRLVPVSEETESTENELLDSLITKLNAVLRQIGKNKATSDEEREFKKERLNILRQAIRSAQTRLDITDLVTVINVMRRESEQLINDWDTIYSKTSAADPSLNNSTISDYASDLREYIAISETFKDVDKLIGDLIYTEDMAKEAVTPQQKEEARYRQQVRQNITDEATAIYKSLDAIKKVSGLFADKFMGQRNLVTGLLKSEAIWKSLSSRFRGAMDAPLASIQILTKLVNNAKGRASKDAVGHVKELMSIRETLAKRGGDLRKLVQEIYQKDDKGGIVNKLVYKYQKAFYEKVDENAIEGNQSKSWLKANIDIEAYKKESLDLLKKKIERIKYVYEEDIDLQEKLIEQERNKWDISSRNFNGWNNYIIKRHPLEKWQSEEYNNIAKDADLLKLYNFITQMNEIAGETGYIQNKIRSTFIPFVRKSMAESLSWDFSLSAITSIGDNLKLRVEDTGYGSINELTKEVEYSIPKYYTHDFTKQENGVHDYSDVSEDLFKNMILYINHMHNYKYLSEVEDQLQLVKTVESFKGHLATDVIGNVIQNSYTGKPQEVESNEENTKIFDVFLRAIFYEEKYPLSDGDTTLNISVRNSVKKAINTVAGTTVYEVEENPDPKSLMKTMDTANRAFQLKTLGFEFISGAVNWFGNNVQLAAQAGNYFKIGEVFKNEGKLFGNRFKNDDEREMFIQLIDVFMPMKDDPNYENLKKAGLSKLTRRNFTDMLMYFMREPEQHMEKTVFLTLLDNTMVENGKLVNIREFVNNKYKNRYDSAEAYREASPNIEKEIEELKKTRSLSNTKKLVDGKLEIPGFDLNNFNETYRLSSLAKRISRNATGGMTQTDVNKMNMNVWSKSMMVFKGWIPKLLDTRFGEFRKVSDDFSVEIDDDGLTTGEKYDIGRVRLFSSFLHFNLIRTITEINDVLSVNEKGILQIDVLYQKYAENFKKQTGEELTMDKAEFADMIRTNLRNQVRELATLFALLGLAMSMGFFKPDDDEDKATKNAFRWTQKVVDKFANEISFFYNPVEIESLFSGNVFPAVGLFADAGRFVKHLSMEFTGFDLSDPTKTREDVQKNARPVKYLGKMLPLTKSLITYGAIISDDFAKEYDVTIQKDNNK